jgi:hypothetical protein
MTWRLDFRVTTKRGLVTVEDGDGRWDVERCVDGVIVRLGPIVLTRSRRAVAQG